LIDELNIPTPYDEDKDPDKFWNKDLSDDAIPSQKGFLTDMIYYMRGMEVPTLYTIWSGLFLLSTCVKREAYVKWYPNNMFGNIYAILAGPAGGRKSTTIDDIGMPIIKRMQKYIENENIRKMKTINIVKDKMTPESLLNSMLPSEKEGVQSFSFKDPAGNVIINPKTNKPLRYKATSEAGIVLSEMASSIGKRSYTEGFIEVLLDLYNPRDTWDWTTIARGKKQLQRTYLSMLAATTPTGFKNSIPAAALGDGFLSRCILVYQPCNNRRFSIPREVKNGPTMDELSKRLAWICEQSLGEYSLSGEAFAEYDRWYHMFRDHLEANPAEQGFRSRLNINVLKVAFLLRLNRYTVDDKIISKQDIRDAIQLLNYTYARSAELILDLTSADFKDDSRKIMNVLRKYKAVTRTDMLRKTHIPAKDLNSVIDYMAQDGALTISLDGNVRTYPTSNGNEIYKLNKDPGGEEE